MFLRGYICLLIWDNVAIDVSVAVFGDAGMDGVSDVEAWSFLD